MQCNVMPRALLLLLDCFFLSRLPSVTVSSHITLAKRHIRDAPAAVSNVRTNVYDGETSKPHTQACRHFPLPKTPADIIITGVCRRRRLT
ncbi:hypothetical protein IWX49DRAFT_577148 [Phyllosticta citricarpa]